MKRGLVFFSLLLLPTVACKEREPSASRGAGAEKASSSPGSSVAVERPPAFAAERPARLAGSWYAKQRTQLEAQLSGFLSAAQKADGKKSPAGGLYGLVVPHAGYRFSGRTAASAYALLKAAAPRRVFVLGPSHTSRVRGVALVWARRFATPLGALTIDTAALARLAPHPLFLHAPHVDAREHSVEMQMPFIRHVAPDAKVVPLIVGALTLHEVRRVADAIRALLRPGDVVIASSDFTHYGPNYRYMPFGEPVAANLRKLDMRAYQMLAHSELEEFWRFKHQTDDTICGFYPNSVLRAIVGDAQATLMHYDTSGRVIGDFKNSVSYLAIAFNAPARAKAGWEALRRRRIPTREFLGAEAARRSITIARKTLEHHYGGGAGRFDAHAAKLVAAGRLEQKHGVFVTLKRKRDGALRGCIGHVIGRVPLHQGIVENALNAALRDPRFPALKKEELAQIRVEVTVLTPPRPVKGPEEIVIGRDGIILQKDGKQALFLPQVAVEQGWGLARTLGALSRKAGLGSEGWRSARFQVFQGYVYEEQGDGHGG